MKTSLIQFGLHTLSHEFFVKRKLRKTIHQAYKSKFYRKKLDAAKIRPQAIKSFKDFKQLPYTYREEISLATTNPYDLLAVNPEKTPLIYGQTSGTTTTHAVPVFMSRKEYEKSVNMAMRLPVFSLITSKDRVALLYPYTRTFAGRTADLMVQKAGALLIPIGTRTNIFPPLQAVDTLLALKPTILGVVATDAFAIANILWDRGVDPKELGVDKIVIGAEPCAKTRMNRLKEIYGASFIFNFVGQNEVGLPGIPCEKEIMHFPSLAMYGEFIAKDGSEASIGEQATPIITPLFRNAMPLLRYWTDDIVRLSNKPCECGLKLPIYEILGRRQTEVILSKDSIYMPIELENCLFQSSLSGTWYRIEIGANFLKIIAEHRNKEEWGYLEAEICSNFEQQFNFPTEVTLVEPGTLYDYRNVRPGKPMSRIIDHQSNRHELLETG
ncbi:MAG: phenylacetate--CoA ligase family protein [Promethearchaeota archaeon]